MKLLKPEELFEMKIFNHVRQKDDTAVTNSGALNTRGLGKRHADPTGFNLRENRLAAGSSPPSRGSDPENSRVLMQPSRFKITL
jgi:hypothetical protein